MNSIISSKIFEHYLFCETKAFLHSIGETGRGNSFADWVQVKDAHYRIDLVKKLTQEVGQQECLRYPSEPANLKKLKWKLALNFSAKSKNLDSIIQALYRLPLKERPRSVEYIPVRFIFRNTVIKNDKLLLAFDGIILSQLLGCSIRIGKIIYGVNNTPLKVKITPLVSEVQKLIKKAFAIISGNSPPELNLTCMSSGQNGQNLLG